LDLDSGHTARPGTWDWPLVVDLEVAEVAEVADLADLDAPVAEASAPWVVAAPAEYRQWQASQPWDQSSAY